MSLKTARENAGLSQQALADSVHSGRSTIVKLEQGILPLTLEWAIRLAPALKCEPVDLYEDVPIPTEEVLRHMIDTCVRELPAGVTIGEWPEAVAACLHTQLKLFLVDRMTQKRRADAAR